MNLSADQIPGLLVVLFPVVVVGWMIFRAFAQHARAQNDELNRRAIEGVMRAAGVLSFERAVEVIERGGADYPTALQATKMLGDLPPCALRARAIPALIGQLDSDDRRLSALSALSLGRIGNASALPALGRLAEVTPDRTAVARQQSAEFEKQFLTARARREGVAMPALRVRDATAESAAARDAAKWAMEQILQRGS